jgi:hypothetical protein
MADLIVDKLEPIKFNINFEITRPKGGWRRKFTIKDIDKLQPIAETLAMLDGNAFTDSWKNYLQEADAVYRNNGGDVGWAGRCSWIQQKIKIQEDPVCKDLWDKLELMMVLKETT